MTSGDEPFERVVRALQERAKELACLYRVDDVLGQTTGETEETLARVVEALPPGWQHPEDCAARIRVGERFYETAGFRQSPWVMRAPILVDGESSGEVAVAYGEAHPDADEGPFLTDERRLINAIAERVGQYLLCQRLRSQSRSREGDAEGDPGATPLAADRSPERWSVILDFLRRSDRALLVKLTRRMINHLGWHGVREAEELLAELLPQIDGAVTDRDENRPQARAELQDLAALSERAFRLATEHLSEPVALGCILSWIKEDRASFLATALESETPLAELSHLLDRFHALDVDPAELPPALQTGLKVALARRFFTDDFDFLNAAKSVVEIEDFRKLAGRTVFAPDSHGKLGGKAAGLFVAGLLVERSLDRAGQLGRIRVPPTWYVASDGLLRFIRSNSLEEVYDRKYLDIDQIRREYPYLVQVFKSSAFPRDLGKGLAMAVEDLGDRPIIVRSSSLLEDRVGSAFSGKYKSLFLANQGSKAKRIAALEDAIAEIYASVFGPDPIEYRARRGLLDVHEEMGILIQGVVGRRVGPYFFPAFSGVAYSDNEFRWSSRLRREDALARLVPGLGTRAVDRLGDDYPILVAPGQPSLRVNTRPDEVVRYAPRKIDVINLESEAFETVEIAALLQRHGEEYPLIHRLVSIVEDGHVRKPIGRRMSFREGDVAVTFEGLIADTGFVRQIKAMLDLLRARLGYAVDIEFASDGEDLFLLQCRAQARSPESAPAVIPGDLTGERVLFAANRHVPNGRLAEITHIVYVDDEGYAALPDSRKMQEVGEAVGKLNKLLPRRRFVLIGPGRWGSRGDVRLGVSVTYSQINNAAMLIEVARRLGGYRPEPSFGTHFFQDLVESEIRYLPLYPDEPGGSLDIEFLRGARNLLPELLPQHRAVAAVLRVIDLGEACGKVLEVLMNADQDRAVGLLSPPAPA